MTHSAHKIRLNPVNQVQPMRTYQANCLDYSIALLNSLRQDDKILRNAYAAKASQIGSSIKDAHKKNIQASVKVQARLLDFIGGRA